MSDSIPKLSDRRVDEAILKAAEALVTAVTHDDSANGGLLSRSTLRAADDLRVLLLRYRARRSA